MVIKAYKESRAYAIKTLTGGEGDTTTAEMRRRLFYHEAGVLKLVDYARIPKCIETFTFQDSEYMVQEYVQGDSLSSMMLKGRLFSEAEIIKIITQLLEILSYLHNRYIIHRDLRLGNLLLNSGQIHLIDFGLARKFQFTADWVSLPEPIPRNASPSYLLLRREISPRSDMFGTGLVALDLMRNWFPDDAADGLAAYPISGKFKEYIKKLLGRSNGFITAAEALRYLKNLQ